MLLAELVTTSRRVGETRSRLEKIRLLAELLARLAPIEIPVGVAYLVGELRQGRIGLGWAAVRDARPGGAAAEPGLTLEAADRAFEEIGRISGAGSKAARLEALAALLARATPEEQDFLRRLVVGELRQGALEGVLVEAVARAADLPAAEVRRAAMLSGELREVATAALAVGRAALGRFRMELLRPVQPMLAGSAESPAAALGKLGRAAFEWKLDGARVQVHRRGDEVRVFTRKLNEVTASVPELVEAALALPEPELVLDGEVLALDAEGRPHPFQVTMRRFGRRLDVAALRAELPLTPFFFDVLHAGGEDWIDRPGSERWGALADLVPGDLRVPRAELEDEDAAEAFFQQALERGHEGLVAKALEAPYEAGRRGGGWLKLKPAHTLDLVVLAAEWGSGRRQGWLSNLHLGARDPTTGGFVMLGKTFKGMTDEVLARQTEELLARETHREGHVVHVRPELVVEIALDGLQDSPHYPGGLALRFARLRRYRADKTPAGPVRNQVHPPPVAAPPGADPGPMRASRCSSQSSASTGRPSARCSRARCRRASRVVGWSGPSARPPSSSASSSSGRASAERSRCS